MTDENEITYAGSCIILPMGFIARDDHILDPYRFQYKNCNISDFNIASSTKGEITLEALARLSQT